MIAFFRVTSRMRNEIICLEVVSILRRCLVQDALVKQLLYTGEFLYTEGFCKYHFK